MRSSRVAGHDFQLWLEQAPRAVGVLTADAA
jgi:hypothetical protein